MIPCGIELIGISDKDGEKCGANEKNAHPFFRGTVPVRYWTVNASLCLAALDSRLGRNAASHAAAWAAIPSNGFRARFRLRNFGGS